MSAATSRRLFSRSLLAVPLAGLLLSACAGQGDINRVQPDAIDKSIFFKDDGSPRVFYYRKTITGVPPTNAYLRSKACYGRHAEGALRDPGGFPGRLSRLRLRARLPEPDDQRGQQHRHARY